MGMLLGFTVVVPEHPWSEELKVLFAQLVGVLVVMIKGSWKDPKNGDGPKPE